MARITPKITVTELDAALAAAGDLSMTLARLSETIRKGYVERVDDDRHAALTLTLTALAGNAADLANALLIRAKMDKVSHEYTALISGENR